jgi:hypothetical protein
MATVPRDGTASLVFYDDFSGTEILAYDSEQKTWLLFEGLADGRPFWDEWGKTFNHGWGWMPLPQELQEQLAEWALPEFTA